MILFYVLFSYIIQDINFYFQFLEKTKQINSKNKKQNKEMAELGDTFGTNNDESVDSKNVTVEMLDYDYVNDCTDVKKLKSILSVLQSGKEGHYPHVSIIYFNFSCILCSEKVIIFFYSKFLLIFHSLFISLLMSFFITLSYITIYTHLICLLLVNPNS